MKEKKPRFKWGKPIKDWNDPDSYPKESAPHRNFAWEFLRRNTEYQGLWAFAESYIVEHEEELKTKPHVARHMKTWDPEDPEFFIPRTFFERQTEIHETLYRWSVRAWMISPYRDTLPECFFDIDFEGYIFEGWVPEKIKYVVGEDPIIINGNLSPRPHVLNLRNWETPEEKFEHHLVRLRSYQCACSIDLSQDIATQTDRLKQNLIKFQEELRTATFPFHKAAQDQRPYWRYYLRLLDARASGIKSDDARLREMTQWELNLSDDPEDSCTTRIDDGFKAARKFVSGDFVRLLKA